MKKNKYLWISRIAIVSALYVVLTLISYPLSYNMIQFRISEILMLLVFFNKKYSISMIIGCLIANFFSFNIVDCIFGTLATALACGAIILIKKLWIASLMPALFNGVIIGLELHYFLKEPLILSMVWVAFGELVVVTIVGLIIFYPLSKNFHLMKIINPE